jgi:hypothetical protein
MAVPASIRGMTSAVVATRRRGNRHSLRESSMILARLVAHACLLAVAVVATTPLAPSAERTPLAWQWSVSEQKRIASNSAKLPKADDGYWENRFKNLSSRSNVSAELAVAGFYYLETAVETFGKVSGLAFSKATSGNVRLVIHDKQGDFDAANPSTTGARCAHKAVAGENDRTDIEFHVVAGQERSAGNFAAALPLADLQYEIGRAFAHLCTGRTEPPAFLERGLAEFFAGWDLRAESYAATTPTATLYGAKDLTLRLMLKDPAFMPTVASLVALAPAGFTGGDADKNAALALSLMDFLIGPSGKRRSSLAKLCAALEKDGAAHDYTQTLLEEKALKKLQQEWRQHLCRIAGRSLMPEQFQFEVEGGLPRQLGLSQGGNYGYRPETLLTPMPGGAYSLVWHDPSAQTIRLMACDAKNRKSTVVAPDFLAGARSLLGCAHTGKNNTYVIAYSRDNPVGGKDFAFHLGGITADGTKIFDQLVFGDKAPTEVGSKGEPGAAGTGRVIYNEATNTVGYYLAHQQRWPDGVRHQGGYIGSLQPNGTNLTKADGWFFSHNFDQRLISSGSSFYALAHGDSYPRALGMSRWNIAGGVLTKQFDVQYHKIPGMGGDNRTDCLTGGLVELNGGKHFAALFATANERKAQDVGITLVDANGTVVTTRWLTTYQEGQKATFPRIARYEQQVFAAWEECAGASIRMRVMLLSPDLNQVLVDKTFADLELPTTYDLVNLTDGSIAWVIAKSGKLLVNRIDLSDKVQADLYALLKARPGFED